MFSGYNDWLHYSTGGHKYGGIFVLVTNWALSQVYGRLSQMSDLFASGGISSHNNALLLFTFNSHRFFLSSMRHSLATTFVALVLFPLCCLANPQEPPPPLVTTTTCSYSCPPNDYSGFRLISKVDAIGYDSAYSIFECVYVLFGLFHLQKSHLLWTLADIVLRW